MQLNFSIHLFPSPFHHPRQCPLSWFSLSVRVPFASSARTNLSAVIFGYLIYSHCVPCFCSFCQDRIPIIFDTLASPSVRSLVRWSPSFLLGFAFSSLFCLASDAPLALRTHLGILEFYAPIMVLPVPCFPSMASWLLERIHHFLQTCLRRGTGNDRLVVE